MTKYLISLTAAAGLGTVLSMAASIPAVAQATNDDVRIAEIIVYGAANRDAHVTLQGAAMDLHFRRISNGVLVREARGRLERVD